MRMAEYLPVRGLAERLQDPRYYESFRWIDQCVSDHYPKKFWEREFHRVVDKFIRNRQAVVPPAPPPSIPRAVEQPGSSPGS